MKAPAGLREDLRGECRQIIKGRVCQELSLPLIAELAAVYLLPDSQYDSRTGHTPDARRAPGSLAGCQAVIRYPLKLRAPVEPGIAPESCRDPCQLLAVGPVLGLVERLDEITEVGARNVQVIIAGLGTDMSVFPSAGHAAAWARQTLRTLQSGATARPGCRARGR